MFFLPDEGDIFLQELPNRLSSLCKNWRKSVKIVMPIKGCGSLRLSRACMSMIDFIFTDLCYDITNCADIVRVSFGGFVQITWIKAQAYRTIRIYPGRILILNYIQYSFISQVLQLA